MRVLCVTGFCQKIWIAEWHSALFPRKYEMKTDILKFLYYSSHWPVKNIIGWFTSEIGINRKMTRNLLLKCYYFQNLKNCIGVYFDFSFRVAGERRLKSNASSGSWMDLHSHCLVLREMSEYKGAHSEPILFSF